MADLQTVLRDLGLPPYGRKPDLIQRTLQLIDSDENDSDVIDAAKKKISEIYNQRKSVEIMAPNSSKKAVSKRNRESGDSSEDETQDKSLNTNTNEELSAHYKRATIQTSLALIVLAIVAYALINNKIDFSRYQVIVFSLRPIYR